MSATLRKLGQWFNKANVQPAATSSPLVERLRKRGRNRATTARSLRCMTEALEDRTLFSLDVPQVTPGTDLTSASSSSNRSTPSIAYDPANSQKMVAVYTDRSTSSNTSTVGALYSVDGGGTWKGVSLPANDTNPVTINPNTGVGTAYPQSVDASVAFDGNDNFYITYSEQTNDVTDGEVVLRKYNFSGNAPAAQAGQKHDLTSLKAGGPGPLYVWSGHDPALHPTLAVDSNPATFTDPDTGDTQNDPLTGNVYVAWGTNETTSNLNANSILLIGSDDGGTNFSSPRYVNDNFHTSLVNASVTHPAEMPKLVISDGTASGSVTPGMVGIVWDDFGSDLSGTAHQDGSGHEVDWIEFDQFTDGIGVYNNKFSYNSAVTDASVPVNDLDTITLTADPGTLGGTYTLSYNGATTGPLSFNATAAQVQAALTAIMATPANGIISVNVVDDPSGTGFDVTIAGVNNGSPFFAPITGDFSLITGTNVKASVKASKSGNLVPGYSSFPAVVNVTDPNLLNSSALLHLTVSIDLTAPTLDDLEIDLIDPNGNIVPLVLARDNIGGKPFVDANNQPTQGVTGSNLGLLNPYQLGTIFDDSAAQSIATASTVSPFIGRYQPEVAAHPGGITFSSDFGLPPFPSNINLLPTGDIVPSTGSYFTSLDALVQNLGAANLNGTWHLVIIDTTTDAATVAPATLNSFTINISAGVSTGNDVTITKTRVRGATSDAAQSVFTGTTSAAAPDGIGPGAVIASDNTLGSFSTQQGRLYVAYVDKYVGGSNPSDNTDIYMQASDDGGLTWDVYSKPLTSASSLPVFTAPQLINDDNASTDGFSEANVNAPGTGISALDGSENFIVKTYSGRAQFQPSLAVDPQTGIVALTFYDARNDANRSRVATYLATSVDGGQTFLTDSSTQAEPYLNQPNTALDAITGQTVTLGPIPDNESSGNNKTESTFGFGTHQGLTIIGGKIFALWSGNLNAELTNGNSATSGRTLNIFLSTVTLPAGPRITQSTQGPVSLPGDTLNPSLGHYPAFQNIDVQFDRPIQISSFQPSDVLVWYRDVNTPGSSAGTLLSDPGSSPVTITPLDPDGTNTVATKFVISLASPAFDTGTYSYTIDPSHITGAIRYFQSGVLVDGSPMDQSGNATGGEAPTVGTSSLGDLYSIPSFTSSSFYTNDPISGFNFVAAPYDSTSYPIVVPGPHVVSTFVPSSLSNDTFTATGGNTNVAIPDGDPVFGALSLINVPLNGRLISDLSVNLSVTHADLSQIAVNLIAPDGTTIPLVFAGDLSGADLVNTTLSDDQSLNTLDTGSASYTGTFLPSSGFDFSQLAGSNPHGNWLLQVTDDTADGVTGTIDGWSLQLSDYAPVSDNLVLNNTVSALTVQFDREMDPSTIYDFSQPVAGMANTYAALPGVVQRLIGPVGEITGNFTVTQINYRTYQFNLPIPQYLNGTYNLTLSSSIESALKTVTASKVGTGDVFTVNVSGSVSGSVSYTAGPGETPADVAAGLLSNWSISGISPFLSTSGNDLILVTGPGVYASITTSTTDGDGTNNQTLTISGEALDTNLNAGVDMLRGTSTPTTLNSSGTAVTQVGYNYSGAAQTVGGGGAGFITTSTITIPTADDFVIGGSATVPSVTLKLNVTFSQDKNLEMYLFAPGADTSNLANGVQLFAGPAISTLTTGANFTNTIFNDLAATPIVNGGAPYLGSFKPQTDLVNFPLTLSDFNGTGAAGDWTLEVIDTAGTAPAGTLNSWSLTFAKPVLSTGLGEATADQANSTFRIFTMDPTNAVSSSTWTAVGGASLSNGDSSGRIGGLAVDPSDPTGNTVYAAGASGGVWKTSNFLTTDSAGPKWIPLTDFGPTTSLNVGSIAVFGRNDDPKQTILYVATGEGDTATPGVGFLRSMDGGATWTVLDSSTNVDAQGNTLPMSSAQRDHIFVGTTAFKVVVDPNLSPQGDVIVYAALASNSTSQGGIWRSTDSGNTWTQVLAGNGDATDVVLDPNSGIVNAVSNPTGNLQALYAAFRGQGIYYSVNRGASWTQILGGNNDPLIQVDGDTLPLKSILVNAPAKDPNSSQGRIILAKPFVTSNPDQDKQYEGWLYAIVVGPGNGTGLVYGLFMTKDFGQNWTLVRTPTLDDGSHGAVPSNDTSNADYDVTGGGGGNSIIPAGQGNYDISFAIDPQNPNVVYIGGSSDTGGPGFMRVDTTGVSDAHSFYQSQDHLGGTTFVNGNNSYTYTATSNTHFPNSINLFTTPVINLLRDPTNPFTSGSTILLNHASAGQALINDGSGATWTPVADSNGKIYGSTDQHELVTMIDPITGLTRLIFGDDQGVFSSIDTTNQSLTTYAGSTYSSVQGPRNGNIQITQFYYGALQPSNAAAQVAGALFYGMAQDDGFPTSSADELTTGNIGWGGGDGDGAGVATNYAFDPTLGATDTSRAETVYEYQWPCCGPTIPTDFFQVNGIGRTFGLLTSVTGSTETRDDHWPNTGGSDFAVNPINGDQILMSSQPGPTAKLFETTNQGIFWTEITPTNIPYDGQYAGAVAYGAPQTNSPGSPTNFFLYAGTNGGHIYMSLNGGGLWTNISSGLDGSAVKAIVTDPVRGTFDAYAVTTSGVFYIADSHAVNATWVNITSNLKNITNNAFGDSNLTYTVANNLTSIAADWRYMLPDASGSGQHPLLYVSGDGGIYRSTDQGATWTLFPSAQTIVVNGQNVAIPAGGDFPNVLVSDLDVSIGNVNPTTGFATLAAGDPDLLLATTYGRGSFGIRLAPIIDPNSLLLAENANNPLQPTISGYSEITAFGNTTSITITDVNGNVVGTGTTDDTGFFSITIGNGVLPPGSHLVFGVTATDDAGATSELIPVQPEAPDLITANDSGQSNTDNITNVNKPTFQGFVLPNAQVQLFVDGVAANGATATGDPTTGAYSITLSNSLSDGTHAITITETLNSVTTAQSAPLSVTIDTIAPAVPNAPDLIAADDSGQSNTDNLTNVSLPTVQGTVALGNNVEPNAFVELLIGSTVVGSGTADANGEYSIQLTTPLTEGDNVISARQTDIAGNASNAGGFGQPGTVIIDGTDANDHGDFNTSTNQLEGGWNYIESALDNIGPNVTDGNKVIVALDQKGVEDFTSFGLPQIRGAKIAIDDSFAFSSLPALGWSLIHVDGGANIDSFLSGNTVSGTTPGGAAVNISLSQVGILYLGTTEQAESNFDPVTFSFTTDGDMSDADLNIVNNHAADILNFVSGGAGLFALTETPGDITPNPISTPFGWLKAVVPSLNVVGDQVDPTDPIFNGADVTITPAGQIAFPNLVPADLQVGPWHDYFTGASGKITALAQALDETLTERDLILTSGVGGAGQTLTITLDTTPPAVVADPDMIDASDTGISNTDNITNDTLPTFTGQVLKPDNTPESLASVDILATPAGGGAATVVGTGFADSSGNYSITITTPLTEGDWIIQAQATDYAGNTQTTLSSGLQITIDLTAPAAPSAPDLTDASDSGISNADNLTNIALPTFTGTGADPNATVEIFDASDLNTMLGTATADGSGDWTITLTSPLSEGSHSIVSAQLDEAGNFSAPSAALTVVIDTTAPSALAVNINATQGSAFNGVVATYTDVHPNGTAIIDWNDGIVSTGTISLNNVTNRYQVSGTHTYAAAGTFNPTVTITDEAGNSVSVGPTATVADPAVIVKSTSVVNSVEGADSGLLTLATFSDPGGAILLPSVAAHYSAVINWGDGSATSNATITYDPVANLFTVKGQHTYEEETQLGVNYPIVITIKHDASPNVVAITSAVVSDPAAVIATQGLTVTATEGALFTSSSLATFTDPGNPDGDEGDNGFSASINWGDNTSGSFGTISSAVVNGQTVYSVGGSHLYTDYGTGSYTITITIHHEAALTTTATDTANMINPAVVPTGTFTYTATENSSGTSQTVAQFTDPGGAKALSNYSAVINWGDNTTSNGTITVSGGVFSVAGAHKYLESGSYAIKTIISHTPNAPDATATATTAVIGDAPLNVTASAVTTTESLTTGNITVASFTDPGGSESVPGNYSATINWGDGTTSTIVPTYQAQPIDDFLVNAAHTYQFAGTYSVVTTVNHHGNTFSATGTATVSDQSMLAGTVNAYSGTENATPTTQTLLTFSDPSGARLTPSIAANYSAVVDWGDGSATSTITPSYSAQNGLFTVAGSHKYTEDGSYPITITLKHLTAADTVVHTTANVADVPLVATGGFAFVASERVASTVQPVATFTDPAGAETSPSVAANYTATIDWGDNTTSTGTIVFDSTTHIFRVDGGHTYTDEGDGSFTITVTVQDGNSSGTSVTSTATVADPSVNATAGAILLAVRGSKSPVQTIATFTDPAGSENVADYYAVVDWGDGQITDSSSGLSDDVTVQYDGDGSKTGTPDSFYVTGTHLYSSTGNPTITVTIHHDIAAPVTVSTTANVSANPLSATGGFTFTSNEGTVSTLQTVASFIDLAGQDISSNYSATIFWHDGSAPSAGVITFDNTLGQFVVKGQHTYSEEGSYNIGVQINHGNANPSVVQSSAVVSDVAVQTNGGQTFTGVEGATAPNQVVATFSDPGGAEALADYSADINWGDGSPISSGTITFNSVTNLFSVTGSHEYTNSGNFHITTTVHHDTAPDAVARSVAQIADAPVTVTMVPFTPIEGTGFTGSVATFASANVLSSFGSFTAIINWGDGTGTNVGTVVADPNTPGKFSVVGTHTYADGPVPYTATVTVAKGSIFAGANEQITVANAAPAVSITAPAVRFSGPTTFTISATDPSGADNFAGFRYSIDFGDGSTPQVIAASQSNGGAFNVSHSFPDNANYNVTVTATDKDGGVGTASTSTIGTQAANLVPVQNLVVNGGAASISKINTIDFTLFTPGLNVQSLSRSDLVLLRNGSETVDLQGSALTYTASTGQFHLNLQNVGLPDGNYQLQVKLGSAGLVPVNFSKLTGDVNGDGVVNKTDVALVKAAIGTTNSTYDINGDGIVDKNDYNIVKKLNGRRVAPITKKLSLTPGKNIKSPKLDFGKLALGSGGGPIDLLVTNSDPTQGLRIQDLKINANTGVYDVEVGSNAWGTTSGDIVIPAGQSVTIRVFVNPNRQGTQKSTLSFIFTRSDHSLFSFASIPLTAKIS